MAKNKNTKAVTRCTAAVEALTEHRGFEFINHATEIRRLRAEYAMRQCRAVQREAEKAEKAYSRLQVITAILCILFFLVGVALGMGICLMNWF